LHLRWLSTPINHSCCSAQSRNHWQISFTEVIEYHPSKLKPFELISQIFT
jgi:hypothetical protein